MAANTEEGTGHAFYIMNHVLKADTGPSFQIDFYLIKKRKFGLPYPIKYCHKSIVTKLCMYSLYSMKETL